MQKLKTLKDLKREKVHLEEKYIVENELMKKLDKLSSSPRNFNQNIINEIVLFKVNRYAKADSKILKILNKIKSTSRKLNIVITEEILTELLQTKGIGLPMASTILRFKNPNIYQIIDQRVYRIIYGKTYESNASKTEQKIKQKINTYINYLQDLRIVCEKYNIDFYHSDRILYDLDRIHNKGIKISY